MIPDIPANGMTLILGGARSGKSALAEKIAHDSKTSVLFVATATAGDEEMASRIRRHRASRPAGWQTLELPMNVGRSLKTTGAGVVIVDCITLLVSNILLALPENAPEDTVMEEIRAEMGDLIAAQARLGGQWLVVSNEVGLGLVPPYPLGRLYRDALGRANQILAAAASRVIFLVAGLPLTVK